MRCINVHYIISYSFYIIIIIIIIISSIIITFKSNYMVSQRVITLVEASYLQILKWQCDIGSLQIFLTEPVDIILLNWFPNDNPIVYR